MVTMYLSSRKYVLLLVACVCVSAYPAPQQNQSRETVPVQIYMYILENSNVTYNVYYATTVHQITGVLSENFRNVSGLYQHIDQNLKVIFRIIAEQIADLPTDRQTNWHEIVNLFTSYPLLQVVDGSNVNRVSELNLGSRTNIFKPDGSPEPALLSRLNGWFRNRLVIDPDVLDAARITPDELKKVADIVAQINGTAMSLAIANDGREIHTKKFIDINVIRFPDIDNHRLKLYRIQLTTTSTCERFHFTMHDRNKINGVFQSLMFTSPQLQAMNPAQVQRFAEIGRKMFGE